MAGVFCALSGRWLTLLFVASVNKYDEKKTQQAAAVR